MLQPQPNDQQGESATVDARAQRQQRAPAPPLELDAAWRAGRKLSEARRQRGWTLDEVAERIRVRKEFLEALEEMNVKLLPGKAYALAFLRSYARELGIDEKAIVDQFQDESALTREDAQRQIRNPTSKPRRERPWMFAAGVAIVVTALVGARALYVNSQQDVAEAPTAVAGTSNAGSSSQTATAPVSERRVVEIRALVDSWLEARGPDGTVFMSQTLRAGEVYRPDASPGWTLHARDGGAFEMYVNGEAAGLLGTAAMPVLGRPIDGIEPIAQAQLTPPRS